jgi:hypothetical protein
VRLEPCIQCVDVLRMVSAPHLPDTMYGAPPYRDSAACNLLCRRVHGLDRGRELNDAIVQNTASVVEHLGRITGYATGIGFPFHAVTETNRDLKALIGAASSFPGPGFLLPTRSHEVFAWCLENELRLVMQTTLMSIGLYNEPAGAYLASIWY